MTDSTFSPSLSQEVRVGNNPSDHNPLTMRLFPPAWLAGPYGPSRNRPHTLCCSSSAKYQMINWCTSPELFYGCFMDAELFLWMLPQNGRNEPIPSRAWLESGNLFQQHIAFSLYFTIEKWSHISKHGCHGHQWLESSYMSSWALRALRKENTSFLTVIRLQPFPTPEDEPKGSSGCENHRTLALERWGVYEGNDFSEPDSCIFPHIEKCSIP